VHVLLHTVLPGVVVGLIVLAIAWRSQTTAFVAMLFLLVGANSNIRWIQDVSLPGRWGALSAVAFSVVWTLPLRWRARPQRGLGVVLAVFLAYALVSTAWSASPHWTLMRTVSFGVLLWAVFAGIRPALTDPKESRLLARGIVVLLVAVVAASIAYWLVDPGAAAPANQLRGIFLNPAYLALLIGLTYPLVLAQFDGLPRRAYVALSLATAVACIVVITLCQSRAGLAAFVLAALAYEISRGGVLRAAVPLVAVGLCAAAFHYWHPSLTGATHAPFVSPANLVVGPRAPGQSKFSALLSGRNEVWAATADLIGNRPLAGYGFGTGDKLLKASQFKHFAGFTPHNAYLQILLELGALGTVLLLAPLAVALRRVLGAIRLRSSPAEVAAFGAVLLGGLLDGIFEDVFEAAGSPFAPLIWLSCAVVLVRVRSRAPAPALEPTPLAAEPVPRGAYHPSS
jgi:exopolysaccharide production protein ExoQ